MFLYKFCLQHALIPKDTVQRRLHQKTTNSSENRARKSRTTLQNKVRLKVLPEQLTLFVNTSVIFKMYHSIVFYYTVLIIVQKYTLFHILVMKNIVKGLKLFKLQLFVTA